MENTALKPIQKLTISGMVIALYLVIIFFTQSFSFGSYQIRIATSLYALAYLFPFLVIPLGLANLFSNMLYGGLGIFDMLGGCFVGIITASIIVLIRKKNWNLSFIILPIILIPGLFVPIWLSHLLSIPYSVLVVSLCIGQSVPAFCGPFLVKLVQKIWNQLGGQLA